MTVERTCRVCGCTDTSACVVRGVACHWVAPGDDLCSACRPAASHVVFCGFVERRGVVVLTAHCRCGDLGLQVAAMDAGEVRRDEAIRRHWRSTVPRLRHEAA